MTLPVLYSFRRCPYAMRARLALLVSGQACELREVVLRDKPAAMLRASPKGTVPVLITTDGQVLDESVEIMLWTLDNNDPDGWLSPQAGDLQRMLTLIQNTEDRFKKHLDRYKYATRYADADPNHHRGQCVAFLLELQKSLQESRWLFGGRPALADMAIAPFVRQFAMTDMDWFSAQDWPELRAWLDEFLALPLFTSIMGKYPQWCEGDAVTLFAPSRAA